MVHLSYCTTPVFAEIKDKLDAISTVVSATKELQLTTDLMTFVRRPNDGKGQGPVIAFMEWKSELGTGDDAGMAAHTQKHIAQEEYRATRKQSACPCICVPLAGARICIFSAISTKFVTVQPFVEYHFMGGYPRASERVAQVARIFQVFSQPLETLKDGYLNLKTTNPVLEDPSRFFPKLSFHKPHPTFPALIYISKFNYMGRMAMGHRHPIFHAILDGKDVVVKFSRT
ncbi:hypothetical protein OF83DRAFT_1172635 [Amylostereum chailletii]|nr:hypothetical protein OF83DRAFT_1172635 [Amylostereum chailletii]